ncbi:MAG TPA: hypothetical protein VH437_17320 [Terriglobales bacterium]
MDDIRNGHNGNGHNGNGNGNGNGHAVSEGPRSISSRLRDLVAVGFRRRVLMRRAFLVSLMGCLLAVMIFGIQYQSEVEIMVKRDTRVEPSATPDDSPRPIAAGDSNQTTLEINTEQELFLQWDVLAKVVDDCPVLWQGHDKPWTPLVRAVKRAIPGYEQKEIGDAAVKLSKALTISPIPTSGILQVQYSASDPIDSTCVMQSLTRNYMAKHLAINRPQTKLYDFFSQQTDMYQKRLQNAEAKLLELARKQDLASAGLQRDQAVQQESNFLATLRTTEATIAQTKEQIRQLESAKATTDPRVSTVQRRSDNAALLSTLKSSLNQLELQRSDYLSKYDPSYRLVQQVEQQIAETKTAIAAQEQGQLRDDTTDRNPVYAWADSDLAKAQASLPSLEAQRNANAQNVAKYTKEALAYNEGEVAVSDLMREVKAEEQNYLLYLGKREQARISDKLDEERVLNVVVAEPPTLPAVPTYSPLLLIVVCFILAGLVAVGSALTADYLDSSFRTPDEVREVLRIPVFASIPVSDSATGNGHDVSVGSIPRNGH